VGSDNYWKELPMLKRYPIIAGALFGILLRLVFLGGGGSRWSPMVGAFIFGAPILVGMLTVYLAERRKRRSWAYYFLAPVLATSLFVAGTLLILIEGLICAIVILPMFALLGGVAGLLMGTICRLTDWPRPVVYCAGALPIVVAMLGPLIPTPHAVGEIERTQVIRAPPAVVWQKLHAIRGIRSEEMADALALRIGVPPPVSGVTRQTPLGIVRRSHWGKQVYFDELIQDWQPERFVRWTYRFHEDSFPRRALDEHVVIGGHYFDLIDTSFTLEPLAGGSTTRLTTRVRYRIATQFNFYANWVAQLLLGNLSEAGLRLYKSRSEAVLRSEPDRPAS
jgi:hypothetical protein